MEKITLSHTPWDISIDERIHGFHNATSEKRVLFVFPVSDATFRYRGYNVAQHLRQSKKWSLHYFCYSDEFDAVQQLLPECDLLVLLRLNWTYQLDLLVAKAKALGIPVIFDVDDLVFDLQQIPLVLNSVGSPTDTVVIQEAKLKDWFADIGRIHLMASRADGFTTTNHFLGERLSALFHKPYAVIRNSLNDEQITASAQFISEKQSSSEEKNFTIGYFAGSPTHANDFLTVAPEIRLFLSEHPDARLLVVGFMKFPSFLQPFLDNGQVVFHPFVNFIELQKLIADVDVNIVPLVENDFTNCKSELKYFEAAIVDTITIATPTYTFRDAITHGKNGFLCRPGMWYNTLQDIYHQRVDCGEITKQAHQHAVETYSGSNILNEIEQAYDFFYNHCR